MSMTSGKSIKYCWTVHQFLGIYFTSEEDVATAKEIFNVHLPRLNNLRQWLQGLAEDK
jgi:lipoprotein NlpI